MIDTPTKNSLRFAVLGAGRRSELALLAHQPENGTRIVAVCDPSAAARKRFQDTHDLALREFEDYRFLMEDPEVDGIFICSPDHLHVGHAVAALKADKHVYLEKPMAVDVAGCDRILDAASHTKKTLFLGHNMRHFPVIKKMKELVDAGAIGEVKSVWCRHFVSYGGDAYFKDWHADRQCSTGLLLQKGVHDLDIIHWLASGYTVCASAMGGLTVYGDNPRRAHGDALGNTSWSLDNWPPTTQVGMNPVMDVEDLNLVVMTLDNGVLASYQQCHYSPDAWRNYTVLGTRGRLENLGDAPGNAIVSLWNRRTDAFGPADEQWPIPPLEGTHGGADPLIIAEFLECARTGKPPGASPVAARQAVAAGCAATLSLRTGGLPVHTPPLKVPTSDLSEFP